MGARSAPAPVKRSATVTLRMPAALKAALVGHAIAEGRTLTSMAERVLADWVKEQTKHKRARA